MRRWCDAASFTICSCESTGEGGCDDGVEATPQLRDPAARRVRSATRRLLGSGGARRSSDCSHLLPSRTARYSRLCRRHVVGRHQRGARCGEPAIPRWRLGRCCTGLVDSDRTTIGLSVAAEVDARILRAGAQRGARLVTMPLWPTTSSSDRHCEPANCSPAGRKAGCPPSGSGSANCVSTRSNS